MKKYNLPTIDSIQIKNFSLFKKLNDITLCNNKNVFCLAGANGLGKSTFITILNYALTGIVRKPDVDFAWYKSIPGFFSKSKNFAAEYFNGRINEEDREIAEVTLEFKIGNSEYKISRGFFEPDELRVFEKKINGKEIKNNEHITSSELNSLFEKNITSDIGLSEFDQFVFLQIYVLTFDETHQLLFWDKDIIERVLHLFFGLDSTTAKTADQLRKEIKKYDSDAKNLQWDITRTKKELSRLKERIDSSKSNSDDDTDEVYEKYKYLMSIFEESKSKSDHISTEFQDTETTIADVSLKIVNAKEEYKTMFNKMSPKEIPIENNKEIIDILNEIKHKIFTDADYKISINKLIEKIKEMKETHSKATNSELMVKLKEKDEKIFEFQQKLDSAQKKKNRLISDKQHIINEIEKIKDEIQKIENENDDLLSFQDKSKDNYSDLVNGYLDQIKKTEKLKNEARKKRDEKRKELKPLELELSKQYSNAESEFIPIFNNYATMFLGLNIDIQLLTSSRYTSFSLDIDDSQRYGAHQLSESQRYFIDIALRMAILELETSGSTMLIDTPEGSLDIAYESRAGKMFADFSKKNYNLILTANINTSQLLLQLAKECKTDLMHIERMTDWTFLSDVQQKEEEKIESAYKDIEEALKN